MKNLSQANIKDFARKKTLSDKIIESKTIDFLEDRTAAKRHIFLVGCVTPQDLLLG